MSRRNPTHPSDFASNYGPTHDLSYGVCSDHVGAAMDFGARLHRLASGTMILVFDNGETIPVVCGDIIIVDTEDGPMTGRCGGRVTDDETLACPGHSAATREYRGMSEYERVWLEHEEDMRPVDAREAWAMGG